MSTTSVPNNSHFDVAIIGGGPAGCGTALSLAKNNEKATFILVDDWSESFKVGESLPPESFSILRYLSPNLQTNLNNDFKAERHLRCTGNASAWASPTVQEQHSIMNPFGAGLHLDRVRFEEMIRDEVQQLCKTRNSVFKKAKMTKVEKENKDGGGGNYTIYVQEADETRSYTATFIIDATGRKATIARQFGAKVVKSDSLLSFYALFETTTTPTSDRDNRTLVEACETGWWYSSKLPDNRRIIAYHTDENDPTTKLVRKPPGFLSLLQSETFHIGKIVSDNDYEMIDGFPRCNAANSQHLEPPFCIDGSHKWVAVGDASMAFDPLSSQGMLTALRMSMLTGQIVAQELDKTEKTDNAGDGISKLSDAFEEKLKEYEKHKKYFYGLATRFEGDFWTRRREAIPSDGT